MSKDCILYTKPHLAYQIIHPVYLAIPDCTSFNFCPIKFVISQVERGRAFLPC